MRISLAFLIVACSACAANSPVHGKPAAPVDITAVVYADRAVVALEFRALATSVDVRVNGTAGLAVTSPAAVVSGGTYVKGETATTVVTFAPPAGRADLVVTVAGRFDGAHGAKTASFSIGQPTAAQMKNANVTVDASGEKVEELPAERR